MGRAMLITASAAVIIFGISQLGLQTQKKMIAQNTGGIGSSLHARNMGVSAIQFAMERLNNDYSWGATENSPWETTINSADVSLYIDETRLGVGTNPDTIMIIANTTSSPTAIIIMITIAIPTNTCQTMLLVIIIGMTTIIICIVAYYYHLHQ